MMHNFNDAVNILTEGLRDLPTDDVTRVRHFLTEYLGDPRRPVPFGGRSQDFARLDDWLAETEGEPYALLAAPAGRGKSALLLRWCQHVLGRLDLAVVYFPVSIRFRTNLAGVVFPALVALLARWHGERLPADFHTSEEVWRGLLMEYLTRPLPGGRRLLLVLDGIDEAADWQAGSWLLPADPPAGLRVVLSARYLANDQDAGAWLERLGWTRPGLARTLDLYPLDRSGIASVLLQMGFPLELLGTRVDIVSELHRLSEGDPLLVRLYVDDLWERGDAATRLTPEDLHAIHPGLSGYFERWWEEQRSLWAREALQREGAVQTVLNLLAGALGPLSKDDILHLLPSDSLLRAGHIEQHLEPLARFVIGDGIHQGYVFSHPRLASYFLEERLSQAEREAVERTFLAWGARTLDALNTGAMAPEKASPYIVQYYGAHLERAEAGANALCALVSNGWRRAWEKLDRAHAGFLGDCERAWRAAERANTAALDAGQTVPHLGAEIRSLLCRASIVSMTSNIAPRLMLEAVKTGVWTPAQGLATIRLVADLVPRARELVGLAPHVQEPLRTIILQEALDIIASLKYERDRLDALVELAPGFSADLLAQVLEMVQALEDEADRAGMLADLAPALASVPELLGRAVELALEIEEEEYLVLALEDLLPHLAGEQQAALLQRIRQLEDERYRARGLTALAPRLPADLLQDVLMEGRALQVGIPQARLLAELVGILPEAERAEILRETLDLLSDIVDQDYRVEILLKLAPFLPPEQFKHLLPEIGELWDELDRARALRTLLIHLPEEHLPAYLETVLRLKSEEQRVALLLQSIPRLPAHLHETILKTVPAIWDEGLRVELLARLAPYAVKAELSTVFKLVAGIKDPGYWVWLLAELEASLGSSLPYLDIAGLLGDIKHAGERLQTLLAIIERVSDEALARIFALLEPDIFGFYGSTMKDGLQVSIVVKIAPRMPASWLSRVLSLVRGLMKEEDQAQALVALAPRIEAELLPDVLDIVRAMPTRGQRARVLEELVATLPEERKGERVREMLQILQIIKDEGERARLFESLGARLAGSFPQTLMAEALAAAEEMHTDARRVHLLSVLARLLAPDQLVEVLQAARLVASEDERARLLGILAPRIPEEVLPAFFEQVRALRDENRRGTVLEALAKHLPLSALPVLLESIWEMQDRQEQLRVLGMLAANPPQGSFAEVWRVVLNFQYAGQRAWLLGLLAGHIPADYLTAFWEEVQALGQSDWQLRTMLGLTRRFPQQAFPLIWEAVQTSMDERGQGRAIVLFAPYVPEHLYPQVFQHAQKLAAFWPTPRGSADFFGYTGASETPLGALASVVPESFFLTFWQYASALPAHTPGKRLLLEKLLEHVPDEHFAAIWNEVRDGDDEMRNRLWEKMARHLPERFFVQVWPAIRDLKDHQLRLRLLGALAGHVPAEFVVECWELLKTLSGRDMPVRVLAELVPRLPSEMFTQVIELALDGSAPRPGYAAVLAWVISRLSAEECAAVLERLLPAQWRAYDLVEVFMGMV
ncbi:MAG TPA: hypothetical protein VHD63_16155, partial [Ktedonobacteraceae bacterium]|nr:hypothetical protein [Ktedonobacteraceae bacterium]